MFIEIHTDTSCFENLKQEWCSLIKEAQVQTIFQTPAFIQSWWKVYGTEKLYIMSLRNEAQDLVAICPFQVITKDAQQVLTFIGDKDITDYQDIIVHPDYIEEVYAEIHAYLDHNRELFSTIELFSVPENSPTRTHLKLSDKHREETQQDTCPVIDLPHNWNSYLEGLDRKQRHEVRRKLRKLTESVEHEFVVVTDVTTNPTAIDEFIKLHTISSADKASFWNEQRVAFFTTFLTAASKHDWLRLFFLKIENEACATMLIFDYNNHYNLYNSGYNPEKYRELSTGQVLTSYTIQDAIEKGKSRYDFLRGTEEYKYRLGGKPEAVFDIKFT